MTPQFRPASEADLDRLAGLAAGTQTGPWTRGQIADSLHAGSQVMVALLNEAIVGFSVMQIALDEAELHEIVIAADWQRRGLGRQLLAAGLHAARKAGAVRMLLEVRAGNEAALRLYTGCGFARTGIRRGYYRAAAGREDAILMEIRL